MAFPRRVDPLELDVAPDEELPDYESCTAPNYTSEDYDIPIVTYHLRHVNRKMQMLVSYGPSAAPSYKILCHGSFRLFSKKPEIQLLRSTHGSQAQDEVASFWFDQDGPLPWRPRARFTHTGTQGNSTYAMESKNFADWTVRIGETSYTWRLEGIPISLVLSEQNAAIVIARFTYSACGTLATNGAEMGALTVYRDGLSVDAEGIEKIICGLLVAIAHFKKMGRHYWNDGPIRASSLTREHVPSHRASFANSAL